MAGVSALTISGCLSSSGLVGVDKDYPTISAQLDREKYKEISIDVKATRQFSDSTPAKIKISFTNISDSEIPFTFGATPPFSQYISQDNSSSRLIIIPKTNNSHIVVKKPHKLPPEKPVNGCWRLPGNVTVYPRAKKTEIDAGETISEEYVVLNYQSTQQCLLADDYHFVSKNYFGRNKSLELTIQISN
jgi:hypothetical protein